MARRNRQFSPILIIFIITLVLVFLFGILRAFGWSAPLENTAKKVFSPVQKIFYSIGHTFSNGYNIITSIGDYKEENKTLIEEVSELKAKVSKLSEVEKENEFLRGQLALVAENDWQLFPGKVIGSDPYNLTEFLIINVGEEDNIKIDMPVISGSGILVGRISEVFPTTAHVLLLTDSTSKIHAILQKSRASGIVQGEHRIGVKITSIPQDIFVEKGERIVTSGSTGIFPQGILIGEVLEVNTTDNELFQEATIKQSVDFKTIEEVSVITSF
ncbi:MAG: rod shape-determining protein MreC [bacterium]